MDVNWTYFANHFTIYTPPRQYVVHLERTQHYMSSVAQHTENNPSKAGVGREMETGEGAGPPGGRGQRGDTSHEGQTFVICFVEES